MAKNTNKLEKKITFRLNNRQLSELERYAESEGLPVSFVVQTLVARFLDDQKVYGLRGDQAMPSISFDGF